VMTARGEVNGMETADDTRMAVTLSSAGDARCPFAWRGPRSCFYVHLVTGSGEPPPAPS